MDETRRRVVVAGGTGLVGRAVVAELGRRGYDVTVVSRRPQAAALPRWAQAAGWEDVRVDGSLAVVNLAGESVGGRWTRRRKQRILESRVATTRRLVQAIEAAAAPPSVFVCASGIDYAGDTADAVVDERALAGSTFLAHVCLEWEREAARSPVRPVELRTPPVVPRDAPAVRLLRAAPVRFGSGDQWFPWIHVDDLAAVVRLAIEDERLAGPVNAVAPELPRQRDAARALGRLSWLRAPERVLRLALGDQADVLLHGQRAVPRKLLELGFEFRHPRLREALR